MTTAVYECGECGYELVETEVGQHPATKELTCSECGQRREFRKQNGR